MKLYRCDFTGISLGVCVSWHTTKAKAEKKLREHRRDNRGDGPIGVECVTAVNVPTTKAELVSWLNAHLNTDNG